MSDRTTLRLLDGLQLFLADYRARGLVASVRAGLRLPDHAGPRPLAGAI